MPALNERWFYLLLAALVTSAWWIGRNGGLDASSEASYWMAVTGGSMMVTLLLYPARKYVRFLHGVGRVKWWFWMHMAFGIAGPWLILVHSSFRIGSINAGVALVSMLVVVLSGIVGRFLYMHVHRGLNGELTTLNELRRRAGFVETQARTRLAFAPEVESALRAFEHAELEAPPNLLTHLRQALWLPCQQWRVRRRCERDLRATILALAIRNHWSDAERDRRHRLARKLIRRYLDAVVRVAQFTAYERVFAFWHVAHLPFVVLLVASAVVHVVAVHAY